MKKPLMTVIRGIKCGYLTMQSSDARRMLPRLREALDCDAVSIVKAPIRTTDTQDHEWVMFELHEKWHKLARAFIADWQQGGRDALDAHYGRKSIEELAKEYVG
ncbi:MAG: hypothetical protein KGL39_35890 [Patescibacteria group bacterium]|nr:hypothetical protein [Patescibacteria group bacterium]